MAMADMNQQRGNMKKKLLLAFAVSTIAVGGGVASAVAPTIAVVKTSIYTGAKNYTASIDHADSVTATPRDSAYLPSTTGGCHLVYHINTRNHAKIIDALYCDGPGTISFRTPPIYTCGVTFVLTATDGTDVSTYTDEITSACPPPPPPGVVVTTTDMSVVFTNPATVQQSRTQTITVPECGHLTSADVFTVSCRLNYAGIGINRYTYWSETITVSLAPGQTVTVVR